MTDLMTKTKFTLPISPSYVAHWGLWEAVRELYQNALDATEQLKKSDTCRLHAPAQFEFEVRPVEDNATTLYIGNLGEQLKPSSLILGNTSKADDESQRGKFGEGYKLALLVLCRLGFKVDVVNGTEWWTAAIEHDDQFGCEVLNVYVGPSGMETGGVQFRIHGISPDQFAEMQKNIHVIKDRDAILDESDQKGRIYVGGLYVCTMKDFKCGYAFAPGTLPLDRDRGMVSDFDLSIITSRLWAEREEDERALELVDEDAADTRYVTAHTRAATPIVRMSAAAFTAKHGADAVPVTTQAEVERAQAAGIKWVLVKDSVKKMLGLVRSWFIPSVKTPVERLRDFNKQYQYNMTPEMRAELADIIKVMSPPEGA